MGKLCRAREGTSKTDENPRVICKGKNRDGKIKNTIHNGINMQVSMKLVFAKQL